MHAFVGLLALVALVGCVTPLDVQEDVVPPEFSDARWPVEIPDAWVPGTLYWRLNSTPAIEFVLELYTKDTTGVQHQVNGSIPAGGWVTGQLELWRYMDVNASYSIKVYRPGEPTLVGGLGASYKSGCAMSWGAGYLSEGRWTGTLSETQHRCA